MKRICVIALIVVLMFVGIGVVRGILNIELEESWNTGDADANLTFQPGPYVLWEKDSKASYMLYWTQQSEYESRNMCWAIVMDRLGMTQRLENTTLTLLEQRKRGWRQKSTWKIDSVSSSMYQNANRYYGISDILHFEHWWKCVPQGESPGVTYERATTLQVHP